ncbi:hypothetical protein ALC62_04177 [Cyphomyrmex costatus]|uniref:Uncharacterized protein n=1 Tax=Cyphomyrmex costatus TaxID=456900 RepID=A0A151IKD9_9HYME|nr:hypothetical protein ALC62_04177 [Cyphomyrmex costatus]
MEYINLVKDRHKLCTDQNNQPIYDSQGCLLVLDMIASWKNKNATRRLIYVWNEHKNDFKSGKIKSSDVWKKPVALASNLKKRSASTSSQNSDVENESDKKCEKKKVRKTRVQKELGEWSASLREDAKRREEARERRHKEIVSVPDRAITAYTCNDAPRTASFPVATFCLVYCNSYRA